VCLLAHTYHDVQVCRHLYISCLQLLAVYTIRLLQVPTPGEAICSLHCSFLLKKDQLGQSNNVACSVVS